MLSRLRRVKRVAPHDFAIVLLLLSIAGVAGCGPAREAAADSGTDDDKDASSHTGDWNCIETPCEVVGGPTVQTCTRTEDSIPVGCEYRYNGSTYSCTDCSTAGCQSAAELAVAACHATNSTDAGSTDAGQVDAGVVDCGMAPYVAGAFAATVSGGASGGITTTLGATAAYTCFDGYEKDGADSTCGANGAWSALPTCTVATCGDPPAVANASISQTYNGVEGPNTYQAGAYYTCDVGYLIVGGGDTLVSVTVTCGADGTWATMPTCVTPQFTVSADEVVEAISGLTWERAVDATSLDRQSATAYCETLTTAGHTDWRMPTIIELSALARITVQDPSYDSSIFGAIPAEVFWTTMSTFDPTNGALDYGVRFGGSANTIAKNPSWRIRCVR